MQHELMTMKDLHHNDKAVAGVVGFILIFAAFITYAAYVARTDVPRWGADAEHAWDQTVGDTLTRLDRSAAAGLGSDASSTITIPPPPEPKSTDIPLVSRFKASSPTGSLAFIPNCGGLTATHTVYPTSVVVSDITNGAKGCIEFREQGSYAPSYGYRSEFGGLVRIERNLSYVEAGPVLQITKDSSGKPTAVSVTFLDLSGASGTVGMSGRAGAPIDLAARTAFTESSVVPNAQSLTWDLTTPYASAWATWFNGQVPGSATVNGNQVIVQLANPTSGMSLSISYGTYDVTIR